MTALRDLKKVELHLHIEGAAPVALVREMARARNVPMDDLIGADGFYIWRGFSEFLAAYDRVAALFVTPDDHRRLAEAVLRDCAAHGVIYAELAISSDHVAQGDAGKWAEYLAAISEGAQAAQDAAGIVARFIPTCIRGLGPERAKAAARLAVAAGHPRIVGLGLAGDERMHAPADFAPAFAIAREAGLGLTAHAGEFGGPDSVAQALDALHLDRVDHGVRAIEDPRLVARLADRGVHLATCPGSNLALEVYEDWTDHPIARLREAGVAVGVSTDDPPFFRTDMTREYQGLSAAFGWDEAEFRAIARASLDAAFCDEATRASIAPCLAR
ncbi:MAG: adenosine deaminase [Pseudomonadota bacterium]|nr:adenosine deaminase [Pseudomonadota bacterium]MEE3102032.1 adenosine deaminase [Pseudomonadota bacterium]